MIAQSPSGTRKTLMAFREFLPTAALAGLAILLFAVFLQVRHLGSLAEHVPHFIGLMLVAGAFYLPAVYLVERFHLGRAALVLTLLGAAAFRLELIPVRPSLTEDAYRYQFDGRVLRAGFNPYAVSPNDPAMRKFQDPAHPIHVGRNLPAVYPPLSEAAFAIVRSTAGYKWLFTGFDLASLGLILCLLRAMRLPLPRSLVYAWNPAVLVSFALCAHNDSLAVFALLSASLMIITNREALSNAALGLAALAKIFPVLLLPVFARRSVKTCAGIFAAVFVVGYLPFASAGVSLLKAPVAFARGWEGNDSLFRLIRAAGNSKPQADLIAGIFFLGIVFYVLRRRLDPLRSSLIILAALLFTSSNAFPWYFTWFTPFLCFDLSPGLMLMTVTSVFGYAPVITYAAGGSFRNPPLMLWLEYAPVYALLVWQLARKAKIEKRATQPS